MAVDPVTGMNAYGGGLSLAGPLAVTNAITSGTLKVGGGSTVAKILSGTATLTWTGILTLAGQEQTIALPGAVVGNPCFASPATNLGALGLVWCAWVSATDTVSVRIANVTLGTLTPSSVAWIAVVFQ